jgi:uncharacterized protein
VAADLINFEGKKMNVKLDQQSAKYCNSGHGPNFQPVDIGHEKYLALINPETAFWMLIKKEELGNFITNENFLKLYKTKVEEFKIELHNLRFNLKPTAVYFNPTERCNFNCTYCYIPGDMRKNGPHMSEKQLLDGIRILKNYFKKTMPENRKPQVIFHGSEPMLNRDAVFAGIKEFKNDINFGIQTNATLLDDEAIEFIIENNIGIGISVDGPSSDIADKSRYDWSGNGYFDKIKSLVPKLIDHPGFNVICTITTDNCAHLIRTVDLFHDMGVKTCMLNIVRCTQERSRTVKPDDATAAKHYLNALDRTYELYQKTGRKLVVANFANILIGILAPSARRLMCDISPCGGGRCFFAVAANGDMFPCSEFVGVKDYKGGNIFNDDIQTVINGNIFKSITERKTEDIHPCQSCALQHFCGAPCPAEAYTMNGGMGEPGAFCEFYEEQVRYAFRLIADKKEDAYLFDGWDKDTETVFNAGMIKF